MSTSTYYSAYMEITKRHADTTHVYGGKHIDVEVLRHTHIQTDKRTNKIQTTEDQLKPIKLSI